MVAGKCVEVQEEGGTAKRGENAAKGTERGMNLADRIHEEEEDEAIVFEQSPTVTNTSPLPPYNGPFIN